MATTSGTYNYFPAASNLLLTAFGRCLIRREMITAEHMDDANNEINLVQVEFSNRQPNLWTTELYPVSLTAAIPTYTLNSRLIAIQVAYLTTTDASGNSTDRIIWPYSTFEYGAIPNKAQTGPPTSYWYNRLTTPQVTLWPVPDSAATYTLNLRICHQPADAVLQGGLQLDLPYRFLDAWIAAVAARIADIYPAPLVQMKGPGAIAEMWTKAERAWTLAATEDKERVHIYLQPQVEGYWRT